MNWVRNENRDKWFLLDEGVIVREVHWAKEGWHQMGTQEYHASVEECKAVVVVCYRMGEM